MRQRLVRKIGRAAAVLMAGAVIVSAAPETAAAEPAKRLFGRVSEASAEPPRPVGTYAKGCLGGAIELPETGPAWQAMRLSRNRNWGHPATISFISRLGTAARAAGWAGVYVGDISQPRGGPMLSGHSSHQIGLDADIWLRPPASLSLSRAEREQISSTRVVRADRLGVNASWTSGHHAVIRAAAEDPAVARIFVNAAIKRALCEAAPAGDRAWLRKVRAWWGHDAHFHVRLACPPGAPECVEQDPPPPGDGCGEELAWWFSDEALNPKPGKPAKPRAEITLADLPQSCAAVLTR